ncbi:MAG: class IV adenylate cyclase [Nitrospirae bacterium]|nr:class IV adenylate cyclase [Nitrospirota bacterium]
MIEIEVKILEINKESIEKKLIALGAKKIFDDDIHAIYYDLPDNELKKTGKALRLRKEGAKVNLALKMHRENAWAKEQAEHEVEVCGFGEMKMLLEGLGYAPWLVMQKHRTSYELVDGTHVELDRYCGPHGYIPEFLEIEGRDIETICRCAEALGFSRHECRPWDVTELIQYYEPKRTPS